MSRWSIFVGLALALGAGCGGPDTPVEDSTTPAPVAGRPSVLLITLDTTRADRLERDGAARATPNLRALGERGVRFTQAYSTVPTTLPSHTSMLTGLYPVDHGIRENGRRVGAELPLVAERLRSRGYATLAFVSGFPLDSQFGLARGFDRYDDDFGEDRVERRAAETTDRVLSFLQTDPVSSCGEEAGCPLFLWVHYYDPHEPYEPPEPFASRFAEDSYMGEIAYMDRELGRLVAAFEQVTTPPWRIVVVGDHGEGLGDHGEALHGNLLYQGVMRVPLIVAGDDIAPRVVERAVSVRQVAETIEGWSRGNPESGLLAATSEPVLAEALKPYLEYGWQPQFMAVYDGVKVIRSDGTEVYDVIADPGETDNLVGRQELDPSLSRALSDYAEKAMTEPAAGPAELSAEARDKLASLGYVDVGERPPLRADAPAPRNMVSLFHDLDIGAGLFIRKEYAQAIPVFQRVLDADPNNLMVALRLAVAYSVVGEPGRAMEYFERARAIDPASVDLHHYEAMHHMRYDEWERAEPLFEAVLAVTPDRLPALEGLAQIYTRQGRFDEAERLLERVVEIKEDPGLELARLGELRMARGDTAAAIRAFERARAILGPAFTYNLELGVLYLANRQLEEAARSLDQVSTDHPGYPMALFKRAQVSVLLGEPDRETRVRLAWERADEATRSLIENERLFEGIPFR